MTSALSRRAALLGALSSPAVIRTPGLMMRVRPPVLCYDNASLARVHAALKWLDDEMDKALWKELGLVEPPRLRTRFRVSCGVSPLDTIHASVS